ncbi:hypothetical protein ACIGHN_12640 [Acidovorax sp. NPDC077693]|uniref:hypothetical protein n=1 Tax=unclassified Acidovorax TaxID=2684926 RepID=UPI0037CBBDBD
MIDQTGRSHPATAFSPSHPKPFSLSLSKAIKGLRPGFDELSPNGQEPTVVKGALSLMNPKPFSLSLSKAVTGSGPGFDRLSPNGWGDRELTRHAATALRICSSTSLALAGMGVPGP